MAVIEINGLDNLIAEFKALPEFTQKAARRAVSRTVTTGVKLVSKKIREDAPLKASVVKKGIKSEKPKAGSQLVLGEINISGSKIPLINYQARQTKKGVTYRISKDSGRLMLKSAVIKPTARGPQVLRRASDPTRPSGLVARYPFYIRFGSSLASIVEDDIPEIEVNLNKLLQDRYQRELNFFLSKQK